MCGHPKREEDEQAHHLHEGQPGGPEALGTAACRKHPERPECCEAHPCDQARHPPQGIARDRCGHVQPERIDEGGRDERDQQSRREGCGRRDISLRKIRCARNGDQRACDSGRRGMGEHSCKGGIRRHKHGNKDEGGRSYGPTQLGYFSSCPHASFRSCKVQHQSQLSHARPLPQTLARRASFSPCLRSYVSSRSDVSSVCSPSKASVVGRYATGSYNADGCVAGHDARLACTQLIIKETFVLVTIVC